MPSSDLTILPIVKDWIYGNSNDTQVPTSADNTIGRIISQASRTLLSYLQRPRLLAHTVNETRSGLGTNRIMLRDWPVISVSSLQIGAYVVPPRPPLTGGTVVVSQGTYGMGPAGFVLDPPDSGEPPGRPQALAVSGFCFDRGTPANVQIAYKAGYQIQNEAATIGASVEPQQPFGRWAQDDGVVNANTGVALTPVSASPSAGQYVPPSFSPTGDPPIWSYTFSPADTGTPVLLTYSYVPRDLEYCCTKLVGEWYLYKGRIGEKTRALPMGGGTATFDLSALTADVTLILAPYRRLLPLA